MDICQSLIDGKYDQFTSNFKSKALKTFLRDFNEEIKNIVNKIKELDY